MATVPGPAIKRRGLKGVSKDGVERVNTEKVCLYCGCTDEDEKRFVRVDRMKKGRLVLQKYYSGSTSNDWLCHAHYQLNGRQQKVEDNKRDQDEQNQAADLATKKQTNRLGSINLPTSIKYLILYTGAAASAYFSTNLILFSACLLLEFLFVLILERQYLLSFLSFYGRIRVRHVLTTVLMIIGAAAAIVGVVGVANVRQKEVFTWSLYKNDTSFAMDVIRDADLPPQVKTGLWAAVAVMLVVLTPCIIYYEEDVFRRYSDNWYKGLIRSILFGLLHLPLGMPLIVCTVWMPVIGLFLTGEYFKSYAAQVAKITEGSEGVVPIFDEDETETMIQGAVESATVLDLTYNIGVFACYMLVTALVPQ